MGSRCPILSGTVYGAFRILSWLSHHRTLDNSQMKSSWGACCLPWASDISDGNYGYFCHFFVELIKWLGKIPLNSACKWFWMHSSSVQSAVKRGDKQFSAKKCSAVQCCENHCSAMQFNEVCCIIHFRTIQHSLVQCINQYFSALQCNVEVKWSVQLTTHAEIFLITPNITIEYLSNIFAGWLHNRNKAMDCCHLGNPMHC